MTNLYSFKSYLRLKSNKNIIINLIKDSKIPCIIYNKIYNKLIYIEKIDAQKIQKITSQETHVLICELDNEKFLVLVKEIKIHPISSKITHMDFHRVEQGDIVHVNVPLKFSDEKTSDVNNLVVKHMNWLLIKTEVSNIPNFINIDLSKLTSNKSIFLKDLILPSGIKIPFFLKKQNLIIANYAKNRSTELKEKK
jgi:large subunit ribosomal protein L25